MMAKESRKSATLPTKPISAIRHSVSWIIPLVIVSFVPQIAQGKPEQDEFGKWHVFGPPKVVQIGHKYQMWWERVGKIVDGLGGRARYFIHRAEDDDPIVFYENYGGIASLVSHDRKLVLLYDVDKADVRVVDLGTNNVWKVDKCVWESHRYSVPPYWYEYFRWKTEPLAFLPDDEAILLCRYVSYMLVNPEEYERLDNVPKNSFYVVETRTGKILKQYGEDELPKSWLLKLGE